MIRPVTSVTEEKGGYIVPQYENMHHTKQRPPFHTKGKLHQQLNTQTTQEMIKMEWRFH